MPRRSVLKVTLCEAGSNLVGALMLGTAIGFIAASLVGILFMSFTELPFSLIVSGFFEI
jgi:hypothetical protein